MKLDKIKFARLIGWLGTEKGTIFCDSDLECIDSLIDVEVPQPDMAYPQTSDINELMRVMAAGTHKIEAIRMHRKLTGWGLKESKDQVEKYWIAKATPPAGSEFGSRYTEAATLGDILATAVKSN